MHLLLAASHALACGGLFCNLADPVDQSGEQIAFDVDEEADRTTMHVSVDYEGPAESFAWVIPVRGIPDLFRSHDDLFRVLDWATAPRYFVQRSDDGKCFDPWSTGSDADTDSDADADADADLDLDQDLTDFGVDVLSNERIGDYETTTLAATDEAALVGWLQANGFDIPEGMVEALAPYVANDMNFVAIKLAKDTVTGQLPPLGLSYEGTTPTIPLRLTAVAALPDMPITVYLAGEHRGVPTNYLHVQLNPLAIDHVSGGDNLDEVMARAADEAGGQAFATLSAVRNSALQGSVYSPWDYRPDDLRSIEHAADYVAALGPAGFPSTPAVLDVLRTFFPVPGLFPGPDSDFYNNPDAHRRWYSDIEFDPDEVTDALLEAEVVPRQAAQDYLDGIQWLTRLRSSVSASEMTLDPTFGMNPDLPEVGLLHPLGVVAHCGMTGELSTEAAPIQLLWPTGASQWVPSPIAMEAEGTTYQDYIDDRGISAMVIEQLSTSGPPEVLVDHTELLSDPGGLPPVAAEEARGCGCGGSAGLGSGVGLLLAGLMVRRRR